jgi:hypothetical protein
VNVGSVFRERQAGDFRLHAGFLSEVLQLPVFSVRDLIANCEQMMDRRRI